MGNITNPRIKPAVESPLKRHQLGVHSRLRNTSLLTLLVPYHVSMSIRTIENRTTEAPEVAAPSSGEIQTSTVVGLKRDDVDDNTVVYWGHTGNAITRPHLRPRTGY